ncbi:Early nodulin-like protein 1 [Apostasia shenzhenica]|uniref:Early nodulin-like protein 1 n=1 Tax=Apostasia shenzhenica TaxID=1088818 RepID=A0A2I0A7P4_9ASPA|nr:Early nodulin-like protein 1 [Apostasia shenzhenica]
MASPFPNLLIFLVPLLLPLLPASPFFCSTASAMEFRVGGLRGWHSPTGNESETFNHWAGRTRFHIEDSLYFKYENDSVFVVDRKAYVSCNVTSPINRFTDGNTTFRFDRRGFFYFISGNVGHCRAGQKLIVRVMFQKDSAGPALAPGPMAGFPDLDGPVGSGLGLGPSGQVGSSGSTKAIAAVLPVAMAGVGFALFFSGFLAN